MLDAWNWSDASSGCSKDRQKDVIKNYVSVFDIIVIATALANTQNPACGRLMRCAQCEYLFNDTTPPVLVLPGVMLSKVQRDQLKVWTCKKGEYSSSG